MGDTLMRIVFHGANAASFSAGFHALVQPGDSIRLLSDHLDAPGEREAYAEADIIVGIKFDASMPTPTGLRLFHLPAAGYDQVDFAALPPDAIVCNCFGHEQAIAEYVMAALLARTVPLAAADQKLRQGDWAYWAGAPERVHPELAGSTIGILGFGHIGKRVAACAKAFGMRVHVANRSKVDAPELVDSTTPLDQLQTFWGEVDWLVVTLPHVPATEGIVDAAAFAAMRAHAVVLNVARGPVIDEQALFDALDQRRIGGAIVDTWYRYPSKTDPAPLPSKLPFETLPNLTMTPHMSGWTEGTIRRRQETIAANIDRRRRGQPCENVVSS